MTDKAQKPKKRASDDAGHGTKCRGLMSCAWGEPDDVVTLSGTDLDGAIALGAVDPHPDAVAYAEGLMG